MGTKFGVRETLAGKGFKKKREKRGKRKPYPEFSPCNGCAALELQGGIFPRFGRQRSAPKLPFSPFKYL